MTRIKNQIPLCVAIVAMAWGGTRTAEAGTLYGLSSSDPGNLYTIDAATGNATLVTPISNLTSLVGLAALNGTLYATDVLDGVFKFGTIDVVTGVFTAINDQEGSANWHGLASDPTANVLYTIDIDNNFTLKSVTPAGVVTSIGTGAGIDGRGMAFDSINGILYATGEDNLYSVDTTTGIAALIGTLGIGGTGRFGLEFDTATGTLYGNSGDTNSLYSIDTTTGLATLIGANNTLESIDGLALLNVGAPVPEPGTIVIWSIVAGLFGVGRLRKRNSCA